MFPTFQPFHAFTGRLLQRAHISYVLDQKMLRWSRSLCLCQQQHSTQAHSQRRGHGPYRKLWGHIYPRNNVYPQRSWCGDLWHPRCLLQANNPDYVLMRLDEILAELMVQVALSIYRKYVTSNAKANLSSMSNWKRQFLEWWRVP